MKKYLVFLLTIFIMGVFTVTASAGALGVNVPPGYVLEVYGQFTPVGNDFAPSFIAGVNDKFALGVMYDTSSDFFTVSGRYCPVKNLAAGLYYRFYGEGSWMADLRGKIFVNESLALSGMLKYDSIGSGRFVVLGQAEYMFSRQWMGNAGVLCSDSATSLLLGADFLATKNLAVGFNCILPTDNFGNPVFEVVMDYLIIKK